MSPQLPGPNENPEGHFRMSAWAGACVNRAAVVNSGTSKRPSGSFFLPANGQHDQNRDANLKTFPNNVAAMEVIFNPR